MAFKISKARVNATARRDGEWVAVGDEFAPGFDLLTRGFTDKYQDTYSAKIRLLQRKGNYRTPDEVPNELLRQARYDSLMAECWLDVRGVSDDAGNVLTAAEFFPMLTDPDYFDLFEACARCPSRVGLAQQAETEEAVKN